MAKKKKLKENEFWCFCCKAKVKAEPKSICLDMYKNGRYALKGICPHKKCAMSKIISDDTAAKLRCKYDGCREEEDCGNKAAEAGGILTLFALLGGAIAYAVKTSKNC